MRDNEVRTNTYHRGREALRDIEADTEKGLTYLKWMAICEALDEARKEAKEEVGLADSNLPTHRLGGGYYKAFGAILKREKLNSDIINNTTRSHAFSVIEHRDEIEAWRKELAKKDPARRASLNHPSSVWRAFSATPEYRAAHPKPPKPPSQRRGALLTQPLTEEQIRQHSGIRPSAEHIKRAEEKQATEAKVEAAKLEKAETELDTLRSRVRVAELAKEALESEVEELKAQVTSLRAGTAPTTPPTTAAKPAFEVKEVSKNKTYRAYVDGDAYYEIELREGSDVALFGDGSSRDWRRWEITKFVGKVNIPYKGMPEKETPEKRKARNEANTKARERTYPKAIAIAQRDYERYK
jgi:hypothetical protein